MTAWTKKSVILCDSCNGVGHHVEQELVDYHRGDYMERRLPCRQCEGQGRMEQTVTTVVAPMTSMIERMIDAALKP